MADKQSGYIYIRGARTNNLKNISVNIPTGKFVVITGLSGSGKSSLAFDTLFAEGQRRYVESFSSYIRQFLERMDKPDVDIIEGLAPAIAIEQKSISRNPHSTVGTTTEIYEYLKILFARLGHTYSPISGKEVTRHSVAEVVKTLLQLPEDEKLWVVVPLTISEKEKIRETLELLLQEGFARLWYRKKVFFIEEILGKGVPKDWEPKEIKLLLDRLVLHRNDSDFESRLHASIETAFHEGDGKCEVYSENDRFLFSNRFEADGITFTKPSPNFFSFNNPYGACPQCEGTGRIRGLDENLIIPNKYLSLYDGAVACWRGFKLGEWQKQVIDNADKVNFPIHKPYKDLSEEQKHMLWHGTYAFKGILDFFEFVKTQSYKVQYRVIASRYQGNTECDMCHGRRVRPDAEYVKINKKSIQDLSEMSVKKLYDFFNKLELSKYEQEIGERLLVEIKNRLQYLLDVGMDYLTLSRPSSTLSGGESQRILLATSLGSSLVGAMYILDEPSIGLHARDTQKLIKVLKRLRDIGNTVIVVEHDEEIIRAADYVIDMGPEAGSNGGNVVFAGTLKELEKFKGPSYTAEYIRRELTIPLPEHRKRWKDYIEVKNAWGNNLKEVSVKFPLHAITVVCGVSGSGKTTLVKDTLYPELLAALDEKPTQRGKCESVTGDIKTISGVELIDQHPIGKSARSNPATYLKIFDDIRTIFAGQPLAKQRGYKAGFFSFNVPGGRCETCLGAGEVTVSMQFMADAHLKCESCGGKRFTEEAREVLYRGKSISDVLDMTIEEAYAFFKEDKSTVAKRMLCKLEALLDVGLGYLQMGQSSSSMSGGEAQRIKLAYYLSKGENNGHMLFIFDEPSTGLHFHDIVKLNDSLRALIKNGHTVIIIEHHADIIKVADWVIEMGPEGGEKGGYVLYEGTPEKMLRCETSITAPFLKEKLVNPEK